MVLPRLIHPVAVKIEQINKAETVMDDDTREPVQKVTRNTVVTVVGQPNWSQDLGMEADLAGIVVRSTGYILFRKVDLDAASVTIQLDDRFIQMGHVLTDVYVHKIEWCGHYPDQDGPSLLKAHFRDMEPSRQGRA